MGACAAVGVAALAAAIAIAGYAVVQFAVELGHGDSHDAARWATLTFFAGGPLMLAYAMRAAYVRLRDGRAGSGERRRRVPGWLLVVVAISVAVQGILAARSYFAGDDWLHIVIAHDAHGGFPGADYFGKVVFIHYAPGLRLSYWLLDQLAPLDWAAGQAALLLLFAGCLLMLHRIFTRLFGDRRSNLLLLLLFGTSILLVTSFLWFADGLHKLPSTFCSLVAIDAYLTWHEKRSKAALAVAVGAVSLGSLFYVKTLLVPLYLVLIRLLFLEPRPRRAVRVLWQERVAWLAFVPTVAAYLWNYFANYAHTRGPSPSLDLLGDYLWLNWFKGVTPALAGVEVGPHADESAALFATFAQLCLIAVICVSLWLKQSAWRAWLFWVVAFCANASLVGLGRLGTMGPDRVGEQLRYDTEMSWLLPLALGFAFFPGKVAGTAGAADKGPRPQLAWMRRRGVRVATAGLVAAYLGVAFATGSEISKQWRERNSGTAKRYVENLRHDVARLERAGRRPVAIDDQVPGFLIGSAEHPLNRLEHLIPAIDPRLRVVVAAPRPYQVGDDGHVGLATLQPLVAGRTALSGSGTVRLVDGSPPRARRGPLCLDGGGALRFDSKRVMKGQSLYALVDYEVERRSARPGSIESRPPSNPGELALDVSRGHELANLGRTLHVALPHDSRVCVRSLAVGWLGSNGR